MFKLLSSIVIASALVLSLSACTQSPYVNNESSKLLGTAINASTKPGMTKEQTAQLLKKCAALQTRISACNTLAEGSEQCVKNAKTQSPVTDQCVL